MADDTERKDTLQQQVIQPQPSPTGYRSGTMDAILNAQRQQPAFRPDVKTQTDMSQWGQNHFVPDSRLTGQTPRDAMNAWSLFHGGQTPVQQPAQTEQSAQTTEAPKQEVPTFGEDLKNEWRGFTDLFRKKENRKYDPTLGKYNVPPPGPDADLSEWAAWFQDKKDYEDGVEQKRQQRNLAVSSLGDMFNALSNLYFTSQYAPSWYSDKTSMTDRQRERYDRLNAAKDASDQAYLNMYLKGANDQDANRLARDKMEEEGKKWRETLASNERIQEGKNATSITVNAGHDATSRANTQDTIAGENARNAANNSAKWSLAEKRHEWETKEPGGGSGSGSANDKGPVSLVNEDKSQYSIDRKIWDDNWQSVYDILYNYAIQSGYKRRSDFRNFKSADKEDFVKQYWWACDEAKDRLMELAETSPDSIENNTVYNGDKVKRDPKKEVEDAE